MRPSVTSLNILDAEQARYRALTTALTGPLPHLEAADRRAQRDRLDRIPHLDADARLRAARNDLAAGLDHLLANASLAVGAVAGIVTVGASVQVVIQFVGGAL